MDEGEKADDGADGGHLHPARLDPGGFERDHFFDRRAVFFAS
jgi:hypothetical protein